MQVSQTLQIPQYNVKELSNNRNNNPMLCLPTVYREMLHSKVSVVGANVVSTGCIEFSASSNKVYAVVNWSSLRPGSLNWV